MNCFFHQAAAFRHAAVRGNSSKRQELPSFFWQAVGIPSSLDNHAQGKRGQVGYEFLCAVMDFGVELDFGRALHFSLLLLSPSVSLLLWISLVCGQGEGGSGGPIVHSQLFLELLRTPLSSSHCFRSQLRFVSRDTQSKACGLASSDLPVG